MLIEGKNPDIFINGTGTLSPQQTWNNDEFLAETARYDENMLTCLLPNFKDYINPFQMRRLSRMLRLGLSAAVISLRDAGLEIPDAIITATGYGFQEDMGKFLEEILTQDEQQLTPTYFMQSTHNALSGLIALSLKCTGYNSTYTGKGLAFESALTDAMLLLREEEAKQVLLGSFDEVYHFQYSEYERLGYVKQEKVPNLDLFASRTEGTILGEGIAFFVLSSHPGPGTWCRLQSLSTAYRPSDATVLRDHLSHLLETNHLTPTDVDVVVSGASGDIKRDRWLVELQEHFFGHAAQVRFKHLTGEYATASSFGLRLGAGIVKTGAIPEATLVRHASPARPLRTALVWNHFLGYQHSFFLLKQHI